MLKTQIATIIITLLLALTFIGNLPYQFLTTSEKNKTITFENPNTTALDPQSVSDVYAAFDLQKNITTNNIKYSHLSNYINNFLVEENKFNSSDYSIKQGPFSHSYILKTSSVPRSVSEKETGIKVGDEVSLEFDLDYTFITLDELNNLINSSSSSRNINYDVLKELQEFTVNLMKEYSNNQNQFQIRYYPFFGELISIENGVLRNTQEEDPNIMFNYQIQNLQNSYAANFKEYQDNNETYRFQTSGQSQLLFESELSLNSSGKYTGLYSPLYFAIRVLEQYFIKYTSNYVKYTTFYTRTSFDDFKDYKKSRDLFNTQYLINPISNLFSVYTYYAGVSPDDI
ncbi:hypothetical protein FQR65_LT16622 [Abscondita terminalis]|nr:hypothetical protein FQR65_LT16622 [Abscondita terminalis]